MKRVASILLVAFLVGIVAVGVGVASQRVTPPTQEEVQAVIQQMSSDGLTELGKRMREASPAVHKELARELKRARDIPATLVAIVNGEEVLLSDMERQRAQLNADAKLSVIPFTVNDQMVAQAVIREKVILAEARKRGLLPTQEEIDEYTAWQKSLCDELYNGDPDAYKPGSGYCRHRRLHRRLGCIG